MLLVQNNWSIIHKQEKTNKETNRKKQTKKQTENNTWGLTLLDK